MKKDNKKNKTCMVHVRCTEKEKKDLDKIVKDCNMKSSDYIRKILFDKNFCIGNVKWLVLAQDFLNYMEERYDVEDKKAERMVDALWKSLL